MYAVCLLKALDGLVVHPEVLVAKPLVHPYLPFSFIDAEAFFEDLDGCLVSAEEVKGTAELFEIVDVRRVKQVAFFKQFQRVMDVTLYSQDQSFAVQCVLRPALAFLEHSLNHAEAFVPLLSQEQYMNQPIEALLLVQNGG